MPKREIDIWDIIIWIGMLILITYIIAKLAGWVNTPEWFNLLPLITITFVIGAFYQKAVDFMDRMYTRTNYMKKNLDIATNRLTEHDKKLFAIEKQQETFNKLLTIKTK